ncbi:alpha/beta hydrolase [Aspergillus puulaauensis]|uniref:Alpha/beta hydrolase fold-3 domain-containing protein n=1 Tax=Aspergillus puulaauensis TaxID=1220207 RepID=A0A7R8APY4_9EURO|nr:uncharacterized protein APUU_50024A [Aspergillus puulaauensis]BCS25313.1 hypothetical protein APUU_50024A [Aspergillus puulaauensis]
MSISVVLPIGPPPPYSPALLPVLETQRTCPTVETVKTFRTSQTPTGPETVLEAFPDMVHSQYTVTVPTTNDNTTDSHLAALSIFQSNLSTSTPRPAVYYIHGGGQISGNRLGTLDTLMGYFTGIDIVVSTIEYRLAPEYQAPAALDDSYAGLVWMADHAAELNIDPARIMVMGISGGGPIAAGTAILAQRQRYPKVLAQMLLTPMLDDRLQTASSQQFANSGPWCGATNQMAWSNVLGSQRGGINVSELVAPSRATNLTGLPSTFIDVGGSEVFRDEAVAYASTLWRSGVPTELHVWEGGFHGFDVMGPDLEVSRAARAAKVSWIKRVLGASE